MMSSPIGKSRRGNSSQTAGALRLLSCSVCVMGMVEISLSKSDPFDLQLLLNDACKWHDLFMNPGCENHTRKCCSRRLRVQYSDDCPVLLCCNRCLHGTTPHLRPDN